ncbi:MAG: response regulator transcription factor [Opitutaceae bacterium]
MDQPLSVLVVDDEEHVRAFLRTLLQVAGVTQVWEADNGPRGQELYRQHKPALVLLDLNMPGPAGVETLAEILKFDPDAMVIIVTSQNDRDTVLKCQQQGASGYLLKSRPKEELLAVLKDFLSAAVNGKE